MTTHTTPTQIWDTIVIGGGAAGLSGAQMLGRSRRRTLVIDGGQPRNRYASHMHGILGLDGTPPAQLLENGREELARYDVEVRIGAATAVLDHGDTLDVVTDTQTLATRSVLLATGITDVLPDIPGLAQRWGTTVVHCPYCHGWEVRDQRLGVLVATPMQAHLPLMVRQLSERVTVFAAEPALLDATARDTLMARGIVVTDSPLTAIEGEGTDIARALTADGNRWPLDAIFVGGTPQPHDAMVAGLELDRTESPLGSFITVQPDGSTSHPRIWAAGNVVDPMGNVPTSASAGAMAGARINGALVMEDADVALRANPLDFWEERYSGADAAWSGKVNPTFASAVATLSPGRSLDLGSGEGADAVYLALAGWDAHGIDLSPTAVARARDAAAAAGVSVNFVATDLDTWEPDATYDLVSASFFHSPVLLNRNVILRRASAAVAPGGHLLVITHAAPPPSADPAHVHDHTFVSARQEADELGLDAREWHEVRVENVERKVAGHDGEHSHLTDGVVLLRRL